ncbi:MAG: c-type cytochrome [Nitrospiraceae bacterium]|nr:c-type cytochrome [Nitrospiraceae bacterium]MSR24146.1 c-type cytochrome [Nitrospiraceae bacterium]
MRTIVGLRKIALVAVLTGVSAVVGAAGCTLFQSEQVAKGQKLYTHYCVHCHGEHGRQNEGYNWGKMPDPRPKDLSNKAEMSTFKDEEIFSTISRDMKDTTPEKGDKIGDDEFAVPTMPTFKHTLSEEEIWSIVAYVRTLHGMKSEFDVAGQIKKLDGVKLSAQKNFDQSKQTFDAAQKKAEDEAEKAGKDDADESVYAKEQDAFVAAKKALDAAQAALTNFKERPKFAAVARPELTMKPDQAAKLAERGKQLYANKYGCNACHQVSDTGGVVGPALDRAGFRLNGTWVFRWVKYPQSMKPDTRMPNLGLSDDDAKAVTLYLATLRAPKPDKPTEKSAN